MNEYLDKDTQIEMLKRENEELKNRLNTYILSQKKYYEANKQQINEKKKEWSKQYYEKKKKEKM